MKNLKNLRRLKYLNFINLFFKTMLFGFITLQLVACGNDNKKRSSHPAVPVLPMTVAPGCQGCLMNPGQLAFMVTTDSNNGSNSLYLGLDFYGDVTRGNFADPKIPLKYNGIIQAKGIFRVQGTESYLCNLMPGEYIVSTLAPGTWQSGLTSMYGSGFGPTTLRLQAQSLQTRQIIILNFLQGVIYNGTSLNGVMKGEVNRLFASIRVESINGQTCMGSTLPIELY